MFGVVSAGLAAPTPPPASGAWSGTSGSENVYRAAPVLPADLRRVAVLPLRSEGSSADLPAGCEILQPVLLVELGKTKKFEVVPVDSEDMRSLSGRMKWTGNETLPADLFDILQRVYGCDAVLFAELTVFRAYAPLAVGWRLKLVNVRTHQIIWAADEIGDESSGKVPHYQEVMRKLIACVGSEEAWLKDNSPRQLGGLAQANLLATLPDRQINAKVSR